ncbi:MAG TPA: hypothetical protein VFT53_04520 [Candidatus Saccharimonadales bacterium]|nr:hypothetical protein [Candidatus Saccharimonadales bacterium]
MLKLQSTSVSIAYPYTRIPYGQYGSAQGGEIAHWGSFSEYLNHMLALQEFAISAMQATELPLGINTKMIKQAMAVVYQDMGGARMLPHLIHGDLRPPNMLANGFVVDWDYAGYGNTWGELVKPRRHIYGNEQALRGLHHGLCSPDGLGLTEEQCDVALRDAETGILLDYLDQLTYTMLSVTYEEAETLQHWEEVQQQQQTKLAALRNHKQAIVDGIEKLSGLPPEHPDRDYIPDYQFTIRHCDTQIIKTIHAHDLLVKKMHKIRAIQEGIAEILTPMPKDPYGDPLGWRAARTQPVWQQLDNEKISRKKEARLHDQLTSLRATYPLT